MPDGGPSSTWPRNSAQRSNGSERDTTTVTVRGFDAPTISLLQSSSNVNAAAQPNQLRRRTSIAERLGTIGNAGGVNSFNNFAASWQRAASFHQITRSPGQALPRQLDRAHERSSDDAQDVEQGTGTANDLLRSALDNDRAKHPDHLLDDSESLAPSSVPTNVEERLQRHRRESFRESLFDPGSQAGASSLTYGTVSSRPSDTSGTVRHMHRPSGQGVDKEREPLLKDQTIGPTPQADVLVGQSTLPQTIFNSVNVLIGVGMLSLPLGIRYSGWLIGMSFFLLSAVATSYTAKLLAKCIDVDSSLVTFADIAYVSFGHRTRVVVSILFTLELLAACVALVILFADSVDLLIKGLGVTGWKVVCGLIMIPLSFLPLRFLSFTSIAGIASCMLIVLAVFVDGLIKPHALGSLREPAPTYLVPANWLTLPLAFGLLMAPWGGHSVFPNIYRDMRHPQKYGRAVGYTYVFTYLLEAALAIAGYLMYGDSVHDEITANIFLTEGYPYALSVIIIVAIAIIPLTKIPLNARPIISTLEVMLGLDARALAATSLLSGRSNLTRGILKVTIRVLVPILLVILAIAIPSFDRVMSLLGSMACFSICIILPCSFHLKIFWKEIPLWQKALDITLVGICTVLAIVGTVFVFLPKSIFASK